MDEIKAFVGVKQQTTEINVSEKLDIILQACSLIAEKENMKVTVKQAAGGAAMIGAGSFFGALLGGRAGLIAGAALASAAAMTVCNNFKSVVDIIRFDLTDSQRKELAQAVKDLMKGVNVTNAQALVTTISANACLKKEVIREISNYVQSKMN